MLGTAWPMTSNRQPPVIALPEYSSASAGFA
jgi:hypothetical protein